MRVLISAGNITAAGPQALVRSLLPALLKTNTGGSFDLLLPDFGGFSGIAIGSARSSHLGKV